MTDEQDQERTRLQQLADVIAEAYVKARHKLLPHESAHKRAQLDEHMEGWEARYTPMMAEALKPFLDNPDLPEWIRPLMQEAANPQNQTGLIVQIVMQVGIILAALPSLGRVGVQPYVNTAWQESPKMPLPPADAAEAVMRGIRDQADMTQEAAYSGYDETTFETLVHLTGEPPGPVDMLSLWRRGVITEDFLDKAILFSRIKDEYIPTIKELAHSWMSPADAIELAIKGIVTLDDAKHFFTVAGGIEEQFDVLYLAAGNAIGADQAMNLWNHKLIDEAEVDRVLGRTRMNPTFYPTAKLLRHKYLSTHQVLQALKAGAVSAADATTWLLQDGVPQEQVSAIVAGTKPTSTTKHKSDTEALVVQQYVDKLLTEAEAEQALAQLGYDAADAKLILRTADAKRADSQLQGAVSSVRHAYLAHHITRLQASQDLDKLNVPAGARDQWLNAWDVEASTGTKTLSEAMVGNLAKKGIITYGKAIERWQAMGYSLDDSQLLAQHYGATKAQL